MKPNKTQETGASVNGFLRAVSDETRRKDALALLDLMQRATGVEPKMWGPTMVGFGSFHYRYESGREGDAMRVGFSPRKSSLVLYLMTKGTECERMLDHLGKHKTGVSCLYINKLADVDTVVLEQLIAKSWALSRDRHGDS